MGLLAKSLKKANAAKTEPFDFESQYERLAELTETAPKPPKVSLRERAKSFLRRAAHPMGESIDAPHKNSERPKLSLRERARRLLQKIKNEPSGSEGGGGSASGGISSHSGTTPVTPMTPPTHSAAALGENGDALPADEETLLYSIFPWNKINAEGELEPTISFGEYSAEDCGLTGPLSNASPDEENSSRESPSTEPLTTFATTMERITENLRNLHSQLDQGNLIRNVHVESAATPVTNAPQGEFTSHHVSLDTAGEEAHPTRMATENAKDVFWPKTLPIDLPARDIKIGGDGRLSVVPGPFQIPYLAADIIPPESEFSYFHRSLKSAELFIGEGEIQLAKIIYERLLKKISDKAIKEKIQKNLDALEDYRKSHDWGNFLPVPPWNQNAWQKNPWHEMPEAKVNVSQMPVEAQNITINMDKGFFEIARALFELKDSILEKKGTADGAEKEPSTEGKVDGVDEGGNPAEDLRGGEDRRKGGIDTWGEGSPDRRSGRDRRDVNTEEPAVSEPSPSMEGAPTSQEALQEETQETTPPEAGAKEAGADATPEEEPADGVMEPPQIPEMAPDGNAMPPTPSGGGEGSGSDGSDKEANTVQEIRGVLELKTPDQEDTPFLTLTYDFTKIPHAYRLAKDNGIFEYAYYKYKPMLVKAHQFIKRKQITRALNYYRVIREQQIPSEFRHMVDRNIKDITEYLQKYLVTRAN